jgi:hypothetical protein
LTNPCAFRLVITLFFTSILVIDTLETRWAMKTVAVPSMLVVVLLAVAVIAEARQGTEIPQIGYLEPNLLTCQLRSRRN